jgi:hypothetical protein
MPGLKQEAIRQSIKADCDFYGSTAMVPDGVGDIGTILANEVGSIMRDCQCDPQTLWQLLSQAFPKVHFAVNEYVALSFVAAQFRWYHIAGVIEGLELAGITVDLTDYMKSAALD